MDWRSLTRTLSDTTRDARFATRTLLRDRTFTVTALLTLVVCLGGNAAIFSIVRSVVLKPLAFDEPDRLVLMSNLYPRAGFSKAGPDDPSSGVPDYVERRRETGVFEDVAMYLRRNVSLRQRDGAQQIPALAVTPSFYHVLRARAQLGRLFVEEDGTVGNEYKAVLAYGFWKRQFGGDGSIVGRDIRLNDAAYRVVGVTTPDFQYLWPETDVWYPMAFTSEQRAEDQRHSNNWTMIARLARGVTLERAQSRVDALNAHSIDAQPQLASFIRDAGFYTRVARLQDEVIRDIRPTLYLLWGGVLLVLLIGGVNLANLVLVRSAGRAREMATRHALGAELGRLGRQLVTETVLLTVAGGALGILAGWWVLRSTPALHLELLPRGSEIRLDWATAAAIFALSLAVGLAAGLMPVAQLSRGQLSESLREGGRSGTASAAAGRVRRGLATAQVVLAFVLLVGAGLLLASFRAILHIDPGFQAAGVVTATVSLSGPAYRDDASLSSYTDRALAQVRALPGVTAAGVTTRIPLSGVYSSNVILAEGYAMKPGESLISPYHVVASDGYFESMRIPLVRGRYFDRRDTPTSPPVVIVDERLAEHFWQKQDPVGHRMYRPESPNDLIAISSQTRFYTVIGVVKDIELTELAPRQTPVGSYYFPYSQSPELSYVITARSSADLESLQGAVRRAVGSIDPLVPVFSVQTMAQRLDRSLVPRRVPMLLALAFGAVALFLAAVGIYGVLAYQVAQRRREIGIRVALGGSTTTILGLVLRDGARIVAVGLAIGALGVVGVSRAMRGLLYGVRPLDPIVIVLVTGLLTAVALVATLIPARRAARVSPLAALSD